MADELSLLWRIRADATQVKTATAESRAAVAQLRQSFGPELAQTVSVTNKAFSDIADNLNIFIGQRLPLVGGAFVRVTENIRGFNDEAKKQDAAIKKVADSISNLSTITGKSVPELTKFLVQFAKIEGQANRDAAAVKFFGAEVIANNQKLLPELEKAASGLAEVAVKSETAGAGIAALAGPVGIAVVALGSLVLVTALVITNLFNVAEAAAEARGKLFDLSQQTGVNVETLSALEILAKTTGGEIGNITSSLVAFQKQLEDAQDPQSKSAELFKRLGIETKDTESAFRQTLAALAAMPEGFSQTNAAAELFGARGGKQILAILKEAKGDLDGAIEKFRELGIVVSTEDAKAADEFNDQLVLVDAQLQALKNTIGAEVMPIVLEVLRQFSNTLRDNREAIRAVGVVVELVARLFGEKFKQAISEVNTALTLAKPIIEAIAVLYERIKDAVEFIVGHPIAGAPLQPGTTTATTPGSKATIDEGEEQAKAEEKSRKQLQGVLAQAFAERQRQARESIALAQREFEAGQHTRQQLLEATIAGNRKQTQAEIDGLEVERRIKLQEAALAQEDLEKRTQISNAIAALDIQIANKRAELRTSEADLRAKAHREERTALIEHEKAKLEILDSTGKERIRLIEQALAEEKVDREAALAEIERIENAALVARGQILKKELALAGVGPDRQKVLDQITALQAERTAVEQRQRERRLEIAQRLNERERNIQLANIDALLELERIKAARIIDSVEALAEARIISEEEAARRILQIRLRLIDDEIEATQAKLKAAGGISDANERIRTQTELNNRLRLLNEQRESTVVSGNRSIDEAREQDLENERRYADRLKQIREDIREIELESAREALRLMVLNFANRRDIIRKQTELLLQEADERHRRFAEDIEEEKRQNDERIRVLNKLIEALKAAGKEASEEYKKAIDERIKALEIQKVLNDREIAELERLRREKKRLKDESKKDEEESTPLGRIDLDIENLKEFARTIEDSIVPLGELLTRTFLQVADAIGQTVANWVLLGETGPAVMRKILAQALASIAAEAAVNAIKELALGFATLFFNPTESASHFTAAALWASIGGVAAIAGRGIAGDLFKPKSSTGGGGSSSGSSQPLQTIVQGRNQAPPPTVVHVDIRHDEGTVVKTWVDNFKDGGITRKVIDGDGQE